LGLFNFYRQFVPAAACILKPLTDALAGSLKSMAAVPWHPAAVKAFEEAKAVLSESALLDHPTADAQLSLVTDASASHKGAVLQQRQQGAPWHPLGFFLQEVVTH
jgi:hypothetical protein